MIEGFTEHAIVEYLFTPPVTNQHISMGKAASTPCDLWNEARTLR